MFPQMMLTKIAMIVFDKVSDRLSPIEDYVHKDNELDIQMREMKMEIVGMKEQIIMLKDLVIKYSGDR